jgi:exopolyphosphatase / guanosine-5'-triphosphate,3'-diphosphate pyrophosphatase
LSKEQRLKIPGMKPGREDVIISGMVILSLLGKTLGAEGFFVSTRGVRYGLAIEASNNSDF